MLSYSLGTIYCESLCQVRVLNNRSLVQQCEIRVEAPNLLFCVIQPDHFLPRFARITFQAVDELIDLVVLFNTGLL